MTKRHEIIGIKQVIRFEWMQKTVNSVLAGLDAKTIRQELHEYFVDRMGNGSQSARGKTSKSQIVNMLINIWVVPNNEFIDFRNSLLAAIRENPSIGAVVHWGMLSAAYPFWFAVAQQTGRLFALQQQVTQIQIINRLKEKFGDRQTVSRYARYVIRSFHAWGVLKDSRIKGCYEKTTSIKIIDEKLASLLLESALHATPGAKASLNSLIYNPAFFPFTLPPMNGSIVSQNSSRIDVIKQGLEGDILRIK
jgi:hypothetical protein